MTNDNNHYIADEGKTFVRLIDNKIMGNELYLGLFVDGSEDTIDNYKEEVDSADNWRGITIEEADQIKKEQEASMDEEHAPDNQPNE